MKTVGVHNWEELGLEESGSGRLKMKGSSSERTDPEVRGRWEGQDCHLLRSLMCSVTSSITEMETV